MGKSDKLLHKIRNNPKNVSFSELEKLLFHYGFEFRRSRGSHHIYSHKKRKDIRITIPFKRPHVGAIYVKKVIEMIEQMDIG